MDDDFDAIIVGGGLSGLTASLELAREGLSVMLLERGAYCGAKNVSGGRIYSHVLKQLFPDYADRAPLERCITRERLTIPCRTAGNRRTLEYASTDLSWPGESYTVLRGVFDQWLGEEAEQAGAMLVSGITVDGLLVDGGRVHGIVAAGEEMECNVVILAEGVNGILSHSVGLQRPKPDQIYTAVKEVRSIDSAVMEKHWNLASGEGLAWTFYHCGTRGGYYDGFLYTNKDSLSIGIYRPAAGVFGDIFTTPELLEEFKQLPEVAGVIANSRLVEYSAHLLPQGAAPAFDRLYAPGVLVAGDAAILCADYGYTVRGMDFAMESGHLAAQTVIEAVREGDFSIQQLSSYAQALRSSFVGVDLADASRQRAVISGLPDDADASMLLSALKS